MNILTKFEVTCEKKNPTIRDLVTFNRKKVFYIWATWVINWFRDKIDTNLFGVITIRPTDETMEMFWNVYGPILDEEIKVIKLSS